MIQQELRVVEVKGSLPTRGPRQPQAARQEPPRPTRAEALDRLRSMQGADAVISSNPALGTIGDWRDMAYWSPNLTTGESFYDLGLFIWGCDFTDGFNPQVSVSVNEVVFWGSSDPIFVDPDIIQPPPNLSGQVWCEFKAPLSGTYLYVARVSAESEAPDPGVIECSIDGISIGQITLGSQIQTFVVTLDAGVHRFVIQQVSGGVVFNSVTCWLVSPIIKGAA